MTAGTSFQAKAQLNLEYHHPVLEDYFSPATEAPATPDADGFIRRWSLLEPIAKPEIRSNAIFDDTYLNGEFAVSTVGSADELPPEALASGYSFSTLSTPNDMAVSFIGNSLSVPARSEFLRALVAYKLGIGVRQVDLKAFDAAYRVAFPNSTPINVNKKKREPP